MSIIGNLPFVLDLSSVEFVLLLHWLTNYIHSPSKVAIWIYHDFWQLEPKGPQHLFAAHYWQYLVLICWIMSIPLAKFPILLHKKH